MLDGPVGLLTNGLVDECPHELPVGRAFLNYQLRDPLVPEHECASGHYRLINFSRVHESSSTGVGNKAWHERRS